MADAAPARNQEQMIAELRGRIVVLEREVEREQTRARRAREQNELLRQEMENMERQRDDLLRNVANAEAARSDEMRERLWKEHELAQAREALWVREREVARLRRQVENMMVAQERAANN